MAAEKVQEELVEACIKDGTEKRPAPGTGRLGGGDDRARACEDPGLQAGR